MPEKKEVTYADAGVNIFEEGAAIEEIWKLLPKTFKINPNVIFHQAKSHYGGIVDVGIPDKLLVVTVDGVGSKVLIAEQMKKFDTVGIDCIAMNVNDLICVGAEPLVFVDYFAFQRPSSKMARQIAEGLVEGALQSRMVIIGGETATLPDIIKGHEGYGFDLAGTAIGLVDKEGLVLGDTIEEGDIIYGINSNGMHSNGFSLARKVLLEEYSVSDKIKGFILGEELLKPTSIYVQEVLEMLTTANIHGLANITGGAFMKLGRLLRQSENKIGVHLDNLPKPQPIFKLIQEKGNISDKEMYKTFNMGIGFCVIAPESEEKAIKDACKKQHKVVTPIGKIVGKRRITLDVEGKTIEYPTDKY
jgi:phosphoribosylformylglycinamidine cyclo-ligase